MSGESIEQRIERVAAEAARLPRVCRRLVFVGRDGVVLFVGEEAGSDLDAPKVGEEIDRWLAEASIERLDDTAARKARPTLSHLVASPRSVLRIANAKSAGGGARWLEWTSLGPLGDEPGEAFLVSDVTGSFEELGRMAEADGVRRLLAERVLASQRMESLGSLTARVAHDFNNLLTPIIGNVGLALLDLPPESPIRKRAMAIKQAANRATALTRQLLQFAARDLPTADAVSLSHTVEEMQLLLEAVVQSNTKLQFDLKPDVPWIEVDAGHVGQVVMNFVVNASEALQPGGGTIEVRTGAVHLGAEDLAACVIGADESEEGVHAFVEVADAGPGIAESNRQRVFEPLFSTRAASRGTGLAAVAEVARGYGGAIELDSAPGRGTRVRMLFPLAGAQADLDEAETSPNAEALSAAFGREGGASTVLVVDDDAHARKLMADVLRREGYRVREAASGPVAMSLFERHRETIDAVVLDYAMPLLSGADLFDAMRKLAPDARVVLVSGYAPRDTAHDLMRRGLRGFVQKPFEPDELVAAVAAAIAPDEARA